MHIPIPTLFTGLLLALLTGCSAVPVQLQLVSASPHESKQSTAASCLLPRAASIQPVVAERHGLNPQRIAVLNWNIYKGQRDNWQQDFRQLIQQQDIILLQEALLHETFETQLREQNLHWTLNHSFHYGDNKTGVLTAARNNPLTSCGLRATEPLIRTPKTALLQTYRISGHAEPLMVANIHGINFTLGTASYEQQLTAIVNILNKHQGPIIFAGDFNNWSDDRSAVLERMVKTLQLDAVPYSNHNRTRVFGHTIDHIYYRGLEVVEHKTIEVSSSDHNPIMVQFRINQSQLSWNQP